MVPKCFDIDGNEIEVGMRVERVIPTDDKFDEKRWGKVGEIYTVSLAGVGGIHLKGFEENSKASSDCFRIVNEPEEANDTEHKLSVMRAWLEGAKIEFYSDNCDEWIEVKSPLWNWEIAEYRVKPSDPVDDYIDWSHVSDEFKFMVRNNHGTAYVYTTEPRKLKNKWSSMSSARVHSPSYKAGNKPWQESLVKRP